MTAEENLKAMWEGKDDFWEQKKGSVIKYKAQISRLHNRILFCQVNWESSNGKDRGI